MTKEDYNNEDVCFCSTCLSLNIQTVSIGDNKADICMDCGSEYLLTSTITDWQKRFKDKKDMKSKVIVDKNYILKDEK